MMTFAMSEHKFKPGDLVYSRHNSIKSKTLIETVFLVLSYYNSDYDDDCYTTFIVQSNVYHCHAIVTMWLGDEELL